MGEQTLLDNAKRVGEAHVSGQPAVHFHQRSGKLTIDSWLAGDGTNVRVLKTVWDFDGGTVITMLLSEFDSAPSVDPQPPESQIAASGS